MNQTNSELKLPSADVVTVDNLWQLVQDIAATSERFTQEQLQTKTKLPKNTTIRVLAYLKYLNFIDENRKDEVQGDKKIKVQYFTLNKGHELVGKIQYELKASRKDSALELWNELIRKHELAQVISKDFLGSSSSKTKIDLENFLKNRKELEGHNPGYYQNGVGFIIRMLTQAGVISSKGDDISLLNSENATGKEEIFNNPDTENAINNPNPKLTNTYKVSITGPGLNTSMDIQEEFDIDIVEKYLEKIRGKLSKSGAPEPHENTEPTH